MDEQRRLTSGTWKFITQPTGWAYPYDGWEKRGRARVSAGYVG